VTRGRPVFDFWLEHDEDIEGEEELQKAWDELRESARAFANKVKNNPLIPYFLFLIFVLVLVLFSSPFFWCLVLNKNIY